MCIHRAQTKILHTLILGCGGRGTMAAYHCRELLLKELFENNESKLNAFSPIRIFAVDSTKQPLQDTGENHDIGTIEVACPDNDIQQILNNPEFPETGSSVKAVGSLFPSNKNYKGMLKNLRDSSRGMSTCPPMGRMNFLGSWGRIYAELKKRIESAWKNPASSYVLPVEPMESWNQVFIVAGLYGGTGTGIHIDLAAMLRFIFKDLEIRQPVIYGIFFLPDITGQKIDLLRANSHACLKELDYFLSGNSYTITLANRKVLTISNEENDCLFNKVFLINDRNKYLGTPGIQLTEREAAQMVGELLFHWSCTTLGEKINDDLQDAPNTYTTKWAPKKDSVDKRITAYSTFGLSTAAIPYQYLKQNLIAEFAIDVMNTIMLRSDSEVSKEKEEIEKKKEITFKDIFKSSEVFNKLKLTENAFLNSFKIANPLRRLNTMEEFIDENDMDLKNAHLEIKRRVENLLSESERLDERNKDFIKDFKENLAKEKNGMLKQGGPELTKKGLVKIRDHIIKLRTQIRSIQFSSTEELRQRINSLLNKGWIKVQEKHGLLSFFGKKRQVEEYEKNVIRSLKRTIEDYDKVVLKEMMEIICEKCLDAIEDVKSELFQETKKFEKILDSLRNKLVSYHSDKLHLSPIPNDILDDFVDDFPFPTGSTPKDIAEEIRENGIKIEINGNKEEIPIYQFDDHPQKVAETLLREAEKVVEKVGTDYFNKSFAESGMFPIEILPTIKGWHLHAYENTVNELTKRSSPYLEYQDKEGDFETYKQAYVIYPKISDVKEQRKWEEIPITDISRGVISSKQNAVADTECSPYSITMLQFHYGLPLYCIDETEEWLESYKKILEMEERPLHKFNLPFPEVYINITEKKIYSQNQIKELYQWAKKASSEGLATILVRVSDTWVIDPDGIADPEEKEVVESFYYDIYERVFLPVEEIKIFIKQHPDLKNYVKNLIIRLNNTDSSIFSSDVVKEFIKAAAAENKDRLLLEVLEELSKLKLDKDEIKTDGKRIHIVPEICPIEYRTLLKAKFYKRRESRELKDDIADDKIVKEFCDNPKFFRAFLRKCREGIQFMKQINKFLPLPDSFEELAE